MEKKAPNIKDPNQLAKRVVELATMDDEEIKTLEKKKKAKNQDSSESNKES